MGRSGAAKKPKKMNNGGISGEVNFVAKAMNPAETFQLIKEVDEKLRKKNGIFDEEAHNAKR